MQSRSMLSGMNCPECNAALAERPATFDGKLYVCPTHGPFGVTEPAETSGFWDLPSNIRIGAIRHARANAVRRNYPLISTYHF